MRLLQINSVYKQGSTGEICYQIDREFQKENLGQSKVLFFWGVDHEAINAVKCAPPGYSKIMALKSRLTGKYGFVSEKTTDVVLREIKSFNPDIIHLHNVHDHTLNLEKFFQYIKQTDVKLIWTFHDCWAYTGYCSHYTMVKCNKWMDECNKCPLSKKYSWVGDKSSILQKKKRKLYEDFDIEIIAPSHWLKNEIKKSFLGNNNIDVIYNGIDLSAFKPTSSKFREQYCLNDKHIVLGVAYKWDEKKGIDVICEMAERLPSNYTVVIVGDASGISLPANVVQLKRTQDKKELAAVYTAADVFINPTKEEVFGLVNVEALACGTPVITFDIGGSPESIDNSCGKIVKNSNEMLQAIVEVCEENIFSPNKCIERSKLFDSKIAYKKYVAKYAEMMNS